MGGNQEKKEKNVQAQQVILAYPPPPEDEIDIADLVRILWIGRRIIFGSFIASIFIAVTLALILPKTYRASETLLPPSLSDVAPLTVSVLSGFGAGENGFVYLYKAEPLEVYEVFKRNLRRVGLRYKFFSQNHLAQVLRGEDVEEVDPYELFEQIFNKKIRIDDSGKGRKNNNADVIKVVFDGKKPKRIAEILQEYVAFIDSYTAHELIRSIRAEVNIRRRDLKETITALRETAALEHKDRIAQLREGVAIAERLGIKKPTGSAFVATTQDKHSENDQTSLILDSQHVPLYFRGSIALKSELEQLMSRQNDDSFISGLRKVQGELHYLQKWDVDPEKIHTVQIDRAARTGKQPVKPKVKLIVALSGILGLLFGIFMVFSLNFFRSVKIQSCQKS